MAILYSKNGIKIVSLEYFKLDLLSPGTKKNYGSVKYHKIFGSKIWYYNGTARLPQLVYQGINGL